MVNRESIEILSWRLVAEFVSRYPETLRVIETHPGGGESDCLTMIGKGDQASASGQIDLNRPGSAHIEPFGASHGAEASVVSDIWEECARASDLGEVIARLAQRAGLPPPAATLAGTGEVLTYQVIAAFLERAASSSVPWKCRNGYNDTSGEGGGVREHWFATFPDAQARRAVRQAGDLDDQAAYRFWFLVRGDEPQVCLETIGIAWDRLGRVHDLTALYQVERRLLPLVVAVAGDLML